MVGIFSYPGSTVEDFTQKLVDTSTVVIAGNADYAMQVPWVAFTEIAGLTPALTIEIYDGTTSTYLRFQKAMAAKETFLLESGQWLNKGTFLRVTAGTANAIDVVGVRSIPNTQGGT